MPEQFQLCRWQQEHTSPSAKLSEHPRHRAPTPLTWTEPGRPTPPLPFCGQIQLRHQPAAQPFTSLCLGFSSTKERERLLCGTPSELMFKKMYVGNFYLADLLFLSPTELDTFLNKQLISVHIWLPFPNPWIKPQDLKRTSSDLLLVGKEMLLSPFYSQGNRSTRLRKTCLKRQEKRGIRSLLKFSRNWGSDFSF